MSNGTAEQYIEAVRDRIPRAFPERRRLEADLRLHLAELLATPFPPSRRRLEWGRPKRSRGTFWRSFA